VRASEWAELQAALEKHPNDPELQELVLAYKVLLEDNPLQDFRPINKKQAKFLECRTPIKLLSGGNRAGKTLTSLVDDLIQAVDESCLPEHLRPYKHFQPPFLCRVVSPDFTATMEGAVFETIRRWVPRSQLQGDGWEKGYDKQRRMLHFKNGSWFQFLTAEQDIDKHSGAALDRVHFDEEPPGEKGLKLFRENMMRLIDRKGQLIISMTPLFSASWVLDEIVERRDQPHITVIRMDMDENPTLDGATKEIMLSGMSKEEVQARKEGKFVYFEGLVYPEFNKETHVVDGPSRESLKKNQDIVCIIDPGLTRTAVAWVAFDGDNTAVVFDELYLKDSTVEATAEEIKAVNKTWEIRDPYYLLDPSARNRSLVNAEQVEGEFQRQQIYTVPAQNSVEAGMFQVKRRLQQRPVPALLVARNCEYTIWEFSRYRWGEPGPDGKKKPIKRDDHLMDCIRYACLDRAWGSGDWDEPISRPRRYQPDFEPKWDGESLQVEIPPLGAMS
jgi:hypothetical protein